ncbi:hypothetical protein M3175_07750 [Robertmurraya korlensis]|uniref:hypothetical protein n=1 Tax=Robertmurraya korlensis TaxID=519977 RepID=UPI00203DBA24|nr:hypothetical protein [Robertmurraya korlensis]MCM3600621.1 hypothetical protein [Robertmurraya korlensis]
MAEIKVGFRAVFYSGEKKIDVNPVRKTYEEAEQDIKNANEAYDMFKYTPWTHAQVEKVHYRH